MKYKISRAKFEDARGIALVHVQSWRETYKGIINDKYLKNLVFARRAKRWQEMLSEPKANTWTFVSKNSNGKIIAFISGGISRDKQIRQFKGELFAIYILKKYQKNKIGYRLIKKLCLMLEKRNIHSMFVCVLKDNISKSFYTKYGAEFFKTKKLKIGEQKLVEEYYGWKNFKSFL